MRRLYRPLRRLAFPPLRRLGLGAVELLLPSRCAVCGSGLAGDLGSALCPDCHLAMPWLPADTCALCQSAPPGADLPWCASCAARDSPLSACVAAVSLRGACELWIRRFKYPVAGLANLDPTPAVVMREIVREAAARAPGKAPEWVVPIPLHARRLRARGFNPAALLARDVAAEVGARFLTRALRRTRDTPSQTARGRRERLRNVAGAFELRRGIPVAGRVWLVDDVVTTGATLEAAARALRRAGCREVVAVCAARTLAEH